MDEHEYFIEIADFVKNNGRILSSLLSTVKELAIDKELVTDTNTVHPRKYNKATAQINSIQFIFYPEQTKYVTLGERFADIDNRGRVLEHHIVLLLAWYYTEHPDDAEDWHQTNIQLKLSLERGFRSVYAKRPNIKSKADFTKLISEAKKATEPIDYQPSSQQPMLIIPVEPREEDRKTHYYSHRALEVIGRREEQKVLKGFASNRSQAGFQWMQIAGEAGQGKSRLALELAKTLKGDWNAGFISTQELQHFNDKWRNWRPAKPTLIIVDYVIARTSILKQLFYYLSLRRDEFLKPVRLLIVERQRWINHDLGNNKKAPHSRSQFERSRVARKADWFSKISEFVEEDTIILSAASQPDLVELTALSLQELADLTVQWARTVRSTMQTREPLTIPPSYEIEEHLHRIDATGRPLYAYFLGEALARQQNVSHWQQTDLLNETLNRNIRHRWRHYFDGKPPYIEEDHPALRIAVLATLIRKVDTSEAKNIAEWFEASPEARTQALAITDNPISDDFPSKIISGLEPDLLGEWLVVSAASERGIAICNIVATAWIVAPTEMAAFLERLTRDFPAHQGTRRIFGCGVPDDDAATYALQSVASTLITNLSNSNVPIPPYLLESLENAASSGDKSAVMTLAHSYGNGVGIEQNVIKSAKLYRDAAELGVVEAMVLLGTCFAEGRGVEQNITMALRWFLEAALRGNDIGMLNVGIAYASGYGVERDTLAAELWFLKSAEKGNNIAMLNLGLLSFQKGNDKDDQVAVEWFLKSANADNIDAMVNLGLVYANGRGIVNDISKAASWFEKAAIAGDVYAMTTIAKFMLEGTGVERNPEHAFTWLGRAALMGDASAMLGLAHCYENGLGIEHNDKLAKYWLIEGNKALRESK